MEDVPPIELTERLREHNIQPTPQRLMVAQCLAQAAGQHPTAEQILGLVRRRWPAVSRATVYNTLNLFAERGLVRRQILREGTAVYDPTPDPHHHLLDLDSGQIVDLPPGTLRVEGLESLEGYEVLEVSVLVRARRSQP
ncbi:MAG: transcriptional repressor [Fimbriimonadales bacterium]|nr:transcriptional repressor [Fimbriimonadales bacterium]